ARLFELNVFSSVILLRIAASFTLILIPDLILELISLSIIVITSWLMSVRTSLGGDGSDQMGYIVSIGMILMTFGILLHDSLLIVAGIVGVGGQLTLSYFTAGVSKLLSPVWRSGRALQGVMDTHSYGHKIAASVAKGNATFSTIFCWIVILGEALFPIALL